MVSQHKRQWLVFAVIVVGVLTTVATSQPRWMLEKELAATMDSKTLSLEFELTAKSDTFKAAEFLVVKVDPETDAFDKALRASAWSVTIPGLEPETRPLSFGPEQKGSSLWIPYSKSCAEASCSVRIRLTRAGDTSDLKLTVKAGFEGRGDTPKDATFKVRAVP